MDYSEVQQDDHSEPPPSAGQTIPYEDYSVASSEEEDGTTERSMKPQSSKKGAHKKTTKQQHSNARPSRKRSSSSISSSSSSDSSSSSSIFSSSDDDNSDASDDDGSANKKKKIKKKKAAGKTQPSSSNRRRGGSKESTTTADDGSINKLISVALKSQKKQYKNQIIQSVKSDLMNTLRSRIVQQQRGKKATPKGGGGGGGGSGDIEDEDDETTVDGGGGGGSIDREYRKRIKQAYKEHEEGYDDAPKFNSKQHKKTIGSILSKLGEVNDIELFRIPHIDKEMGLDRMEISARDTKLSKKILSASPDKTIPEAVYAALKDAYSSCMLYKYFFKRIFPYITVPYITSVRKS